LTAFENEGPQCIFFGEFSLFCGKKFQKRSVINSLFSSKQIRRKTKRIQKFVKNHHSCQQYERVLKILYFDILNIAKFG
jgi:hypothetical protein